MNLKDIFLTASSNMFRSKLRTFLTIIAIFIGAFTLTLTNGIGSGVSSYIDKQLGNLGQDDAITITAKNTGGPRTRSVPPRYEATVGTYRTSLGWTRMESRMRPRV